MLTTTDKVRSPMGLLVAKAREWNEGNTEFFEPPATVESLPVPSSPPPGDVEVDETPTIRWPGCRRTTSR